jgi:cyclophilin family peptidyl-prolyl cis-trans isomerase
MLNRRSLWLICAALLAAGCSREPEPRREAAKEAAEAEQAAKPAETPAAPEAPKPAEPPKAAEKAKPSGGTYRVRFDTTAGPFVVEVHPEWAPLGAKRFRELVEDRYYDNSAFFRVVPNFVVQFGLAAEPSKSAKWNRQFKDDPVLRTNRVGTLVYATAGPGTRTTQLFINLRSNQQLDDQGFAPFAEVVEGMDVVQKISAAHGEQPDQQMIENRGNAYLKANFPKLDWIKTARIEG